ncbi:MAG: lycopene cyclase domain-containing protein [Candidatus Bathyarchaeia archaeon]
MYEWFVFASAWLIPWFVLYVAKSNLRREMLWVSAFTALTGFTEPLFVPAYWNPPSLFNLASTTRFDIESFIFTFAIGGIGSVLYETALNAKHERILAKERAERRWLHLASLAMAPVVFVLLFLAGLNPIYCAAAAMLAGSVGAVACRPDLAKNTVMGGVLFTGLYFAFFLFINLLFPTFVTSWNLAALSGVLVVGVPLEELMFAFTFGMFWSGVYEHVKRYTLQ